MLILPNQGGRSLRSQVVRSPLGRWMKANPGASHYLLLVGKLIQILHQAVETAATQTKPAYAGYQNLDFGLVRAGGLPFGNASRTFL